jgi:hypothetical protein
MNNHWDAKVAQFWLSANDADAEECLTKMKDLVDELDPGDPNGLFEWASVHDFVGQEAAAIALYEDSIAAGLEDSKSEKAIIQLASSLINVGEPQKAIDRLANTVFSEAVRSAAKAFLALAHFDAGHEAAALRIALTELYAPDAPYSRSIKHYANLLETSISSNDDEGE